MLPVLSSSSTSPSGPSSIALRTKAWMSSGVSAAGLKLEAAIAATGGSWGWVALAEENVGDGGVTGEYTGDEGEGGEAI